MSKLRKALPFVLLAVVAIWTFSHQPPTQIVHAQQLTTAYDCTFTFHFTSATANAPVPNSNASRPCVAWRVTYTTTGFSTVTVQFETSPDTTPADFAAVPNTGCSSSAQPPCFTDGASPITPGVQGTAAYRAYAKYVRVNVTSVTGSGTGDIVVYGYKGTSASAGIGSLANPGLFVPYTGATGDVNLGIHSLTAGPISGTTGGFSGYVTIGANVPVGGGPIVSISDTAGSTGNVQTTKFFNVYSFSPGNNRPVFWVTRDGGAHEWDYFDVGLQSGGTANAPGHYMSAIHSDLDTNGIDFSILGSPSPYKHPLFEMRDAGSPGDWANATTRLKLNYTGLLAFGDLVAGVPALRPNGTTLEVALGDGSVLAPISASRHVAGLGSAALPSITFAAHPTWGFYYGQGGNNIGFARNGVQVGVWGGSGIVLPAGFIFGIAASADPDNDGPDTALSRCAAGAYCVGTGTAADKTGTLQAGVRTTDPGCTTTAHVGKGWFDITTTTTVYKVCLNVAGTLTWVVK